MRYLLFLCCIVISSALQAQTNDSLSQIYTKVAEFYKGKWNGKGAFANGKSIEAAVSFELDTMGKCLVYKHRDVLPVGWKALALWNLSKTDKQIKAIYNDEFSGMRIFSAAQFSEAKIVFSRSALNKNNKEFFERFVFEKQDANSYKMTWEISYDGEKWTMGDWLLFQRIG